MSDKSNFRPQMATSQPEDRGQFWPGCEREGVDIPICVILETRLTRCVWQLPRLYGGMWGWRAPLRLLCIRKRRRQWCECTATEPCTEKKARAMALNLLAVELPERESKRRDNQSAFWNWADKLHFRVAFRCISRFWSIAQQIVVTALDTWTSAT